MRHDAMTGLTCAAALAAVLAFPVWSSAQDAAPAADPAEAAAPAEEAEDAAAAAEGEDAEAAGEPAPEFTEEFLNDPANFEVAEAMWEETCRHCHGRLAYPGKAPKLQPENYTAEFVYDRVTHGYKGMPPWEDYYDLHQRMAVTAWILSDEFAP